MEKGEGIIVADKDLLYHFSYIIYYPSFFLYITSAPRPFVGGLGLTIVLGVNIGSLIFSIKVKDGFVNTLLDTSSNFFALSFILLILYALLANVAQDSIRIIHSSINSNRSIRVWHGCRCLFFTREKG